MKNGITRTITAMKYAIPVYNECFRKSPSPIIFLDKYSDADIDSAAVMPVIRAAIPTIVVLRNAKVNPAITPVSSIMASFNPRIMEPA